MLQAKDFIRNYILVDGKTPQLLVNYILVSILGIIPLKLRKKFHQRIIDSIFAKNDGKYLCRCANSVTRFETGYFMKETCYHSFEHLSLRVPNNYDEVLRYEYGDYMKFPPEDKRGTHGEIEVRI